MPRAQRLLDVRRVPFNGAPWVVYLRSAGVARNRLLKTVPPFKLESRLNNLCENNSVQ
jgi:hypothetical protein